MQSPMTEVSRTEIASDDQYHHYTGNVIPWYVRLIWIGFWVFAVYYTIRWLFPSLQLELFKKS